ncbi:MAG: DUF4430 domain-containing protein [Lachnospiraceae bacterium]|nr:DUF4430 domain-containing protein [Lachnospiraceae bacterium]
MERSTKRMIIIASVVLCVLIAVFAIVYKMNKPSANAGSKDIVIEVTGSDGKSTEYDISTDSQYLIEAMDELAGNGSGFSYSGSDSEYGIVIESINGEKAIFDQDNAYWALYVNGEYAQNGAGSQPVESGSTYTWTYEAAK